MRQAVAVSAVRGNRRCRNVRLSIARAATSERVKAKSKIVKEQDMEIASSESEVGVSADMCAEKDAVSEILYVLGIVLIYGGGVGLVAYFLLM